MITKYIYFNNYKKLAKLRFLDSGNCNLDYIHNITLIKELFN